MDILFLLVPLSLVLVAAIGTVLFWAVNTGQFDVTSKQGQDIIDDNDETAATTYCTPQNSVSHNAVSEISDRNTIA